MLNEKLRSLGCESCGGRGCGECAGRGLNAVASRIIRETFYEDHGRDGEPFVDGDGNRILVRSGKRTLDADPSAALAYFAVKHSRAAWTRDVSAHANVH